MSARFPWPPVLALCLVSLTLAGCSRPAETALVGDSEAVTEASLAIGQAFGGAASGYWPLQDADFGPAFARIGYVGHTPRAFGEASWLSGVGLLSLTRNDTTSATEMSLRELSANERSIGLADSLAAAYHDGTGASATLGGDGTLSYSIGGAAASSLQAVAGGALSPGAYALSLTRDYLALKDPDGGISVYALPSLELSWKAQGGMGSLGITEESLLYLNDGGGLVIRALKTGAIVADLALGLSPGLVAPVYDGGLVYIADAQGGVLAVDPQASSLRWRVTADYPIEQLLCDRAMVYAFGSREAIGIAKDQGRILARVSLPERALLRPQIIGGAMAYLGVDGYAYANDMRLPAGTIRPSADQDRLARTIRFRLDKYLVDHGIAELAGPFLPYVDLAPHDGILPFTVFTYLAPEQPGEMVLELFEGDGKAPAVEGIVSVFDESGEEIKANVDEFGSHPSFTHWFDAGKRYYLAVGRRAPGLPPLFLRVRQR